MRFKRRCQLSSVNQIWGSDLLMKQEPNPEIKKTKKSEMDVGLRILYVKSANLTDDLQSERVRDGM